MKYGQNRWTREELILAINLYCKLPFGKMHKSNPMVVEFAQLIGRTPSSMALKLGNLASFDPSLQARGIKGASNASRLDKEVWNEFYNRWDKALLQSEQLLANLNHTTIEKLNEVDLNDLPTEGLEKERVVKTRVNQSIFRKIVLATYNNRCCITDIETPELLVASHIVPWSRDEHNRLNPTNGLCLNSLHDKAFDSGLITVSPQGHRIILSPELKQKRSYHAFIKTNFLAYENKEIHLPDKFIPSDEFLAYHREHIFRG